MRFVVDAQLPPALAVWLVAQGHDSVHVFDLDLNRADDATIWHHAEATSAIIVTKDEDFAVRAQLRPGPPVVWIRVGNTRNAVLLRRVAATWPRVIEALSRGETLVELA